MARKKPILSLDFDGCVHSYEKGWQDGSIYGELMPGFTEWLAKASEVFTVTIVSSRLQSMEGLDAVMEWLKEKGVDLDRIEFAINRPKAFVAIDDRAVRFEGDWNATELQPTELLHLKTWSQK